MGTEDGRREPLYGGAAESSAQTELPSIGLARQRRCNTPVHLRDPCHDGHWEQASLPQLFFDFARPRREDGMGKGAWQVARIGKLSFAEYGTDHIDTIHVYSCKRSVFFRHAIVLARDGSSDSDR